ncbi:alpha/beta hydrolase [Pseudonocardia sp. RS11V-5]|uniref:alpha/beta fold hydrolase n=1 Tax=Pseudonocardia terrae TaxID=2905831 RepID=UPI001E37F006|nr:alpha/beta hydrolase [Pseudonocardia terrae]MCE3550496.1 alpha/beta hydrolase [Pseudonocardia terrae]
MTEVHTLDVPGARLHYEVRGSGPLLVVVGSPMSAAHFAPLADALAAHHTVVTTDPRGIANSPLEDPDLDVPVEQRADDVVTILDALGASTADVFGSSGGATTGLALVARHPERLRTLVAHEPPLIELLPDREARIAVSEDVVATFHAEGPGPAFAKFMAAAGFVGDDGAPAEPPPGPPPSEQDMRDAERFLGHDLMVTTRFVPDVEALRAAPTRIVVGIGAESGHLLTQATSTALAERLGVTPTIFPGDHGGFLGAPAEFAEVLTKVLAG